MGGPGILSPGGTFDKHILIILSNIRNIDQSDFFCNYS